MCKNWFYSMPSFENVFFSIFFLSFNFMPLTLRLNSWPPLRFKLINSHQTTGVLSSWIIKIASSRQAHSASEKQARSWVERRRRRNLLISVMEGSANITGHHGIYEQWIRPEKPPRKAPQREKLRTRQGRLAKNTEKMFQTVTFRNFENGSKLKL